MTTPTEWEREFNRLAKIRTGPPRISDEPWICEVTQTGPRTWTIHITQGAFRWGPNGGLTPFTAWGTRQHAYAKARRLLEKAKRRHRYEREAEATKRILE